MLEKKQCCIESIYRLSHGQFSPRWLTITFNMLICH